MALTYLIRKRDKIIFKISDILEKSVVGFNSIGLYEGVLGLSLFNYYLYLDTKETNYLDRVSYHLEQCFDCLSTGENFSQFSFLDLVEVGRYLCFLNAEGIIDNGSTIEYLKELEQPLQNFLVQKAEKKDLDSNSGVIVVGHYFLEAGRLIDYKNEIEDIISVIDELSIALYNNTVSVYWQFTLRNDEKPTIEPSFIHGISGVLFFLALAFEKNIQKETCYRLIQAGIRFLKDYQNLGGINLFPFDFQTNKQLSYQNLVYSNLGIGYAIYRIGIILEHNEYKKIGIGLLENAAKFRDDKDYFIKDAELIYGSSGLFALYSLISKETKNDLFQEAANYWFKKTLNHSNNNTPWAGYETYINGFEKDIQLSFSHGICGIGIALITHKMREDHGKYLSFFNYK